jgi:RNA polymerase sigma-70 factor (ECF subfamily)
MATDDDVDVLDQPYASRLATFNQHRGLLFSIAYRMLGLVADAEDMLQDAFIRWQQASDSDIRSPKAFLITVVSRLCINHLQSARVQREEYIGQWLPEPLVTDSGSDPLELLRADESISMAFLVLLERLTPDERAVFLLHEVFDYGYPEIATVLGKTEANCRQILRRARGHVGAVRPRFEASRQEHDDLLETFFQATGKGEMAGMVALLSKDAVLHSDGGGRATALPNLIYGADNIARAIVHGLRKLVPMERVNSILQLNGRSGVVSYLNGKAYSVLTMEVSDGRIRGIYVVTNPEKLAHLPPATF